jgi:hypothetical protein
MRIGIRLGLALGVLTVAAFVVSCEKSGNDPETPESWTPVGKITVSAKSSRGAAYVAKTGGVYRFRIVAGSYSLVTPRTDWATELLYYKNHPIEWAPSDKFQEQKGYDGILDYWNPKPSARLAAEAGSGANVILELGAGEYVIFIVPDSLGGFENNAGVVNLAVELGK